MKAFPSREEQKAKARERLAHYIDELETEIREIRRTGAADYDYAIETAQIAIRLAAQITTIRSFDKDFELERDAA